MTAETTGPGREPTTEEVFALLRDWLDAYPETDPVVEVQIYREGMRAAPAPAPDADALYGKLVPARIQAYLTGGGLFNPELANHAAVRDLIIDARDLIEQQARELAAARAAIAAADAMRREGVSAGQRAVHPEGIDEATALGDFIEIFDGPLQRDYDRLRAAMGEQK